MDLEEGRKIVLKEERGILALVEVVEDGSCDLGKEHEEIATKKHFFVGNCMQTKENVENTPHGFCRG